MNDSPKRLSAFTDSYRRVAEVCGTYHEWRYLWLLFVLLVIMFFGNILFMELNGSSEVVVAGIARNMMESGDYFLPKLNGHPYVEYPPLFFLFECTSFGLFGYSPWAAKLPAALAAIGGAHMLYYLLRAMKYSPLTAFLSGLILGSSMQYYSSGVSGSVDSLLTVCCITAWWGFYSWSVKEQKKRRPFMFFLLVLGLTGCVMTKNIAGMMVPLSGILIFMLLDDLIQKKLRLGRWLMLFFAILLALLPYMWYAKVMFDTHGPTAFYELVVSSNLGYFHSAAPPAEPFGYYFVQLPEMFQPWLVFLLVAIGFHLRRVVRKHAVNSLYSLTILLVPFVMLTVAVGKQLEYLLPLSAPAAMLVGSMFGMFGEGKIVRFSARANDMIIRVSFYVIFALGLAAPVTLIILGVYFYNLPGVWRYWSMLAMLLLTIRVWLVAKPRQEEKLLLYLALIFALIYPSLAGTTLARNTHRDSFKPMFEYLDARGGTLYLDNPREGLKGAVNFYTGGDAYEIQLDSFALKNFQSGDTVITLKEDLDPDEWRVKIFREKYKVAEKI